MLAGGVLEQIGHWRLYIGVAVWDHMTAPLWRKLCRAFVWLINGDVGYLRRGPAKEGDYVR